MSKIYLEWVEKAEGDYNTALREYRARKNRNLDAVCFHAQQCIEKYLKSYLQKIEIYFPKTHDLNVLLDLTIASQPIWESYRKNLKLLTTYAVEIRYPGENTSNEEAKECIKIMKYLRNEFRREFNF